MNGENNYLRLTLNGMVTDIICTEKSFKQEMELNQLTMVTEGLQTKHDIKNGLLNIIPKLVIKKIQVIVIRKHQTSKKSGHYSFQTGSNRSHLKGNKKFIVSIKDIQPFLDYFNNK